MPTTGTGAPVRARRRAPEARLRSKAQALTRLALETLAEIMQGGGQDAVRLAAAREVLDRGHGRPKRGEPEPQPEGFTVIVKRFTDAPEPDGAQGESTRDPA